MRRLFYAGFILCSIILIGIAVQAQQKPQTPEKESAIVVITDKLKVLDVILQGQYLFEHDDSRMARGEPCMYIYSYKDGKQGELVAKFHCIPEERDLAKEVVLGVMMTSDPDVFRLDEIQFKGSTKGHKVPTSDVKK